ncbi:Xaa-Pro dipeptidyl-peptidase [Burkholderia sp. HI2761]|uniref:Xaa-Pro dipeptidyl-peptidase n=1 Tax=unclassified Burkholderia TaxID=2613784 RepID=UPI000B79CB32|nr:MULTISPECIES: Xaa-Pro dipeptidyl-peptidase [unclassified Burkholderia]MPV61428.1 Xaa-Pro dipeptidyl-peptidase [Burkholderia sp. BE24]OXJ21475.1 Xaa-Pro dipeptidyl-peptidase [Burkholderia sp. HI2761]
METWQRAKIRQSFMSGARLLILLVPVAIQLAGCGGDDSASSRVPNQGNQPSTSPQSAQPGTVTTAPAPAPFMPPTPVPEVGAQYERSLTGLSYPKLAGLYPGHDGPTVENGVILPWLSMRPPLKLNVMVQTPFDTDGDGKPDRIALRIVQPAEVAEGLKTPVIVRPSVYYADPTYATQTRAPFLGEAEYLRMGYTVVYADSIGTNQSDGCWSVMDRTERDAMASVVRWLTGDPVAPGFDLQGKQVAASWSTGHVAMEGISYGGTLPTMVAATGVPGLEAIVPVEGISSGYDYFRYNGVIADIDNTVSLGSYMKSQQTSARAPICEPARVAAVTSSDNATYTYNDFWKARNTVSLVDRIQAATLIAQGQADNNVKTKNATQLYDALYRAKKPVQLWLHSRNHDDPAWQKEWQKQIVMWYSRYLFGVNNGVETQPTYVRETPAGDIPVGATLPPDPNNTDDTLIGHCHSGHNPRDCIPTGELFIKEDAWPKTADTSYYLRGDGRTGGLLTPNTAEGAPAASVDVSNATAVTYETKSLANATRYAGAIRVAMRGRFAPAVTNIKATLSVDGHDVTYGWANPRFYKGLEVPQTIAPNTDYDFSLEMMPRDFTVLPGSKVKLKLEGYQGTSLVTLDLSHTVLAMPVVPKARVAAVMLVK